MPAARAVELDPDSPEAHAARGTALLFNSKYDEAEKHFETAILLNPNLYEPYYFYGRACMSSGNVGKGGAPVPAGVGNQPGRLPVPGSCAPGVRGHGPQGDGEQALRKAMTNLDRHLRMNPDDSWALASAP